MTTMAENSNMSLQLQAGDLEISHRNFAIELNGEMFSLDRADVSRESSRPMILRAVFPRIKIVWRIEVEQSPRTVIVRSTLQNAGKAAVKLGKAVLFQEDSIRLGDGGDKITVLPWQQGQDMQNVYRLDDPNLPAIARIKAQVFNASRNESIQIGFLTFQRADTAVEIRPDASGSQAGFSAYCDFGGWMLPPNASTRTEVFQLAVGNDPYRLMEDWASRAGELAGAKIRDDVPIGYLGWSWVDCINGSRTYEQITLEMLDAINARLDGFGVRYLWTSMTNLQGSLPGNWLKWNTRSIPMGREAFINAVRDRGFVPGFWVGPFYLCSTLPDAMEELREAILKNPDGSPMVVCESWSHGDAGRLKPEDRPRLYALDPSHPRSLAYIRRVFETYRQWGIRYYMVDFLEAGAGALGRYPYASHFDQSLAPGPEAYLKFIRTMKEAAGEDAYLLSSTGPTMHNAGALDAVRSGSDFGEGRALSPESFFYPATFVINQLNYWTGAQWALANHAGSYHTHRKLYLIDVGNVLTIDQPVPLNHARIAASIHAFGAGGTMLGDDIRSISDERLSLIKKTLPRPKEIARPVDLFDSPQPDGPRIFHRQIEKPWQKFDVLAMYNLLDHPVEREVDPAKLGLDSDREYLVWDFWNESYVGRRTGVNRLWVEAESVRILRWTANTGQPALLGTDMHLMMGEMEIEEASYSAADMTFSLRASRPAGETGMAFIHAPSNVYVKNFEGLHIAKDGRDDSLIIGVPLQFDHAGRASRNIQFGLLQQSLDMHKHGPA